MWPEIVDVGGGGGGGLSAVSIPFSGCSNGLLVDNGHGDKGMFERLGLRAQLLWMRC